MSLEKNKPFQKCEPPTAEHFAPDSNYPIGHVFSELERHLAIWQERMPSRSEAPDEESNESTATRAVANKFALGLVLLKLHQAREQGIPLPNLPTELKSALPHAREYALGAYATAILFDTLLDDSRPTQASSVTNLSVVLDTPAPGKINIPWALHLEHDVVDANFEASPAPKQWYQDDSGLLLVERVTPAVPSDSIRFEMQTQGVPENFGALVTLYPHATASSVLEP